MPALFPEVQILVCTHERPPGRSSCAGRGGVDLFEALKREARRYPQRIMVNRTNCLKTCEHGPTVVVQPLNAWYGGVQLADVPELVAAAVEGRIVERLCLPTEAARSYPWGER